MPTIIYDTKEQIRKEQEALQERAEEADRDDPPPDYASVLQDSAAALTISPRIDTLPSRPPSRNLPDVKPSNFLNVFRSNYKLKGVWIIDPSLTIPSAFLPPLREGQTEDQRENLYLDVSNEAMEAEVYILPTSKAEVVDTEAPQRPVIFRGRTDNGHMTLKFHEVPPSTTETRPPYHIDCFAENGILDIQIPRSFKGLISVKTENGTLRFSDAVKPLLTHFSKMGGAERCFLGEFDPGSWPKRAEWVGDTLKLETSNGDVKISFDNQNKYYSS